MGIRLLTGSDEPVTFAEEGMEIYSSSPFFLWVVLGGSESRGDFYAHKNRTAIAHSACFCNKALLNKKREGFITLPLQYTR